METVTAGTLTIATDDPAYEPWFVDNDPTNGEGYESAVAYAIAEQLGYTAEQVEWVTVPFNKVVQPGPKDFDFDVNQVSITEARRKAVDFSSGYFDVVQAVITNKGSAIDGATSRRRARRRQAGRPGRHDQLHRDHRPDPAVAGPGRLRHQRPGRPGAQERPDRRHRRRPAHRLLHDRRAARRRRHRRPAAAARAASRSSSAPSWARTARSPAASPPPSTPCARTASSTRSARSGWPSRALPSCPDDRPGGRGPAPPRTGSPPRSSASVTSGGDAARCAAP